MPLRLRGAIVIEPALNVSMMQHAALIDRFPGAKADGSTEFTLNDGAVRHGTALLLEG